MWLLLLIVSFTSAELVDPDDNIAMESRPQAQALHYRPKYAKPEYYYRPEEEDNQDYDSDDYPSYTKPTLKRPKKYHPQDEKLNVYINKNNYANRAREPRDEGWRPMSLQNEEEERVIKHYHYETTPKPQKQSGYYNDEGSKKQKSNEGSHADHYQAQRPKQQPKPAISSYYDDQHRQPDQSQQQGHALPSPSTFLQQIEEDTKSGKMLGFASLVEHFSAEDDEEEIKQALKEGSLDDIKRTIPKSGMVFKIFQDNEKKPMSIQEIPSNDIDAIEFKPSASTYYAKPTVFVHPKKPSKEPMQTEKKKKMKKIPIPEVPQHIQDDYDEEDFHDEDMRQQEKRPEMMMMMQERPLPKPMPMQQERPQPKPMAMHQERPQTKPMNQERPRPKPQQIEEERPHRPRPPKMEEERPHRAQQPQVEQERPHRPQQLQKEEERPQRPQHPQKLQERPKYPKKSKKNQDHDSKPSNSDSSRYSSVLQDTRSYAQIEAASRQRYRPIQLALTDNDDYNYYHQSSKNYPVKNGYRYQEGQESQQQFQTADPEGYSNHKWQSSVSTSEAEIQTPGSHLETLVVHSSPLKAPESSKYYYDHFKSQSTNHRPETFDHNKALKGSVSFNAANIIGNHNHGSDVETTRTPIQFVSESEATPKYKLPHSGHSHLKQHVQKYAETLFKNMYKIKEDEEEESPSKITSHRHHYYNQADLLPKPTALVSVKLPRFEAETPMMTESEFQSKFGHLPVVTTPSSFYFTTISTPLSQVIELKPTKPQAQALTQYWTTAERDNHKQNLQAADHYYQQSQYKATKAQTSTNYRQPSSYSSSNLNQLSGEALNNNYKNTRGQIEKPSTNWKDGQIYLTKDYKGKLSDLYIKSSDKENFHLGTSNDRPNRSKKVVLNTDLISHENGFHSSKKSKFDVSLQPTSFRLQKRGDKDDDPSKDVALVSENDRRGKVRFPTNLETGFKPMYQGGQTGNREPEKKSFKKQGVILTGTQSNDNDNRQFSVTASYQIHRSSESENGEK